VQLLNAHGSLEKRKPEHVFEGKSRHYHTVAV
jgi:hypothetical protein